MGGFPACNPYSLDELERQDKQAGLITYYAALEHHGNIEFMDRLGLSSRHFDEVRRELDLATGPMGLTWSLEDLFVQGAGREDPAFHHWLSFVDEA